MPQKTVRAPRPNMEQHTLDVRSLRPDTTDADGTGEEKWKVAPTECDSGREPLPKTFDGLGRTGLTDGRAGDAAFPGDGEGDVLAPPPSSERLGLPVFLCGGC